ncbi:hypothetical protein FDH86_gp021 [Arthrobacter phage Tank]|uniref:Uncharacterized protein n=1 Tax=Arthrobacter phage Tank TaxID=1772319 RepID=A0A0U4K3F9_9CAUD|nr:hypothetical protein FDH86_gp021 [Arthrobacter phage Tank]ALY10556.1 hypothetical protein TANK_21 [Arthrobacter phage Tank]
MAGPAGTPGMETPSLAALTRPTVLDVVNVIDGAPGYELFQDHQYETRLTDYDLTDIPDTGTDKEFGKRDDLDHTKPTRFGAYRGLDDQIIRYGAGAAELKELFTLGESLFVEEKLQKLVLSPAAVDLTPTPGTPVTNLNAAIGLLEQWIASRYLYRPTILGNLLAINLIADTKPPFDLVTTAKTPIGIAAGFGSDGPGAAVAGAGQAWLYIAGQVNVWRGAIGEPTTAQDLAKNRELHLIERQYAASVDGPVAAILVGF